MQISFEKLYSDHKAIEQKATLSIRTLSTRRTFLDEINILNLAFVVVVKWGSTLDAGEHYAVVAGSSVRHCFKHGDCSPVTGTETWQAMSSGNVLGLTVSIVVGQMHI